MDDTKNRPTNRIRSSVTKWATTTVRVAGSTIVLITQIAFVAAVGGYIGVYINAQSIVDDCTRVNLAKIGNHYVNCSIVEPPALPTPKSEKGNK